MIHFHEYFNVLHILLLICFSKWLQHLKTFKRGNILGLVTIQMELRGKILWTSSGAAFREWDRAVSLAAGCCLFVLITMSQSSKNRHILVHSWVTSSEFYKLWGYWIHFCASATLCIALYIDGCTTHQSLGEDHNSYSNICDVVQLAVNAVDEVYFVLVRHSVTFVICILQVQE